ncbi:hypothetical protein AX774_g7929 [Zancudomyces culisetae]|uniref:Uncharacterized protein n=1 Tax=Zancudomyces culisetae TaxID=1213189 RepID=A0A1R1PCK3_ZANCU|nr:hypothetical protein AX774_g7929 [Zancudomyces culisetae]|eukprot:OMH78671.1 hypothetical protein AX774_g7929 [Zancudomyces culisetae]
MRSRASFIAPFIFLSLPTSCRGIDQSAVTCLIISAAFSTFHDDISHFTALIILSIGYSLAILWRYAAIINAFSSFFSHTWKDASYNPSILLIFASTSCQCIFPASNFCSYLTNESILFFISLTFCPPLASLCRVLERQKFLCYN